MPIVLIASCEAASPGEWYERFPKFPPISLGDCRGGDVGHQIHASLPPKCRRHNRNVQLPFFRELDVTEVGLRSDEDPLMSSLRKMVMARLTPNILSTGRSVATGWFAQTLITARTEPKTRWPSMLVPNGIDPQRSFPGIGRPRAFRLPKGSAVVLMVSALVKTKRVLEGMSGRRPKSGRLFW